MVVILVVAAVNRTVVYSETVIYDYESLGICYNRSILVWYANSSVVSVALSYYRGLVVDSNSSGRAASLVWV